MCWMISKRKLRGLSKRFGGNAITWNVFLSFSLTLLLCLLIYQKWRQDSNSKCPGLIVQTSDNISLVIFSNLKLTKVSDEPNHQTIDYEEFYCLYEIFSGQRNPDITYWQYENQGVEKLANRGRWNDFWCNQRNLYDIPNNFQLLKETYVDDQKSM